ncbi:VIT family protein [Pseudomonas reactans]|nr:VIT family protein [Pseudomonas reactans]
MLHREEHSIEKIGWLRAAVLGANDGIVSVASLLLGVASANVTHQSILLTGVAGLVAGAMSMATGEYISVSSQSDTEKAALTEEQEELNNDFESELHELTSIYIKRGLDLQLARQVAKELMKHNALAAHARDELGISEVTTARPFQAAWASALSFSAGAILPLMVAAAVTPKWALYAIAITALISLSFLGGVAAKAGGAPLLPGIVRVTFWSALAMGMSSGVGLLFGLTVS